MDFVRIICLISCIPLVYPLKKLVRKQDINIWDLLLIFSTLMFAIIPFISKSESFLYYRFEYISENEITLKVFIYLMSFFSLVLIIDRKWTTQRGDEDDNIINISLYIRHYQPIYVSKIFYVIILAILIISIFWYIPQKSIIVQLESNYGMTYAESSALMIFAPIYSFAYALCAFIMFQNISKKNALIIIYTITFFLLSLFLNRRTMLMHLIFIFLIIYSINIETFTYKKVFSYTLPFLFFVYIYFTFYNVVRYNKIHFNTNSPIESTINIVKDGLENWDSKKEEESSSTESRSLGLYVTLYKLVKYDPTPSYGELTLKSIDFALPSFINPNKGSGIQDELIIRCRENKDVSDSILFDSYGELHMGGFIFALLYYWLFFKFNIFVSKLFLRHGEGSLVGVYMLFCFFTVVWNVEVDMPNLISMTIHEIPILIILWILFKQRILYQESYD